MDTVFKFFLVTACILAVAQCQQTYGNGDVNAGKVNSFYTVNSFAFQENAKFDFLKLNISVLTKAIHVKFVLILKLFSRSIYLGL